MYEDYFLIAPKNVVRFDPEEREIQKSLQSCGAIARRFDLYQKLCKRSESFDHARCLVEIAMIYTDFDGSGINDDGISSLAFIRGAAERAMESHNLRKPLLFKLLTSEYFLHYCCSVRDARRIAHLAVCLEATPVSLEMITKGRQFLEDNHPKLLIH